LWPDALALAAEVNLPMVTVALLVTVVWMVATEVVLAALAVT
jgi:hypothetical protein